MTYEEAIKQIEETLRQIDVLTLYDSSVGREMQSILRRLRTEKAEEFSRRVRQEGMVNTP